MKKRNFQEWLEQLAKKEQLKEIRFISNDYRPRAEKDTIIIPLELFSPPFKQIEREAAAAHELAHLKYRHISNRRRSRKQYRFNCEFQADRFAANVSSPVAVIRFLEKGEKLREKWRKKNLVWRVRIWSRLKSGTHPSMEERKKRLQKLIPKHRRRRRNR
jgi:hypothetical protein